MKDKPSAPDVASHGEAGRAGPDSAAEEEEPSAESIRGWRSEFPILARKNYLNSNSLGALSRRSLRARRRFEEEWNRLGASAWYGPWLEVLDGVRRDFGRTIGAPAGSIALIPSVSAGLTAVADALELGDRNRVVATELDFPTLTYQFLSRRSRGVEVVMLESPDGVTVPVEAFEEAVDHRTALVATSHVFFTTGAIQDAAAIARVARREGALFLLDAYQSNGQIPVDVGEIGPDFLLSGSLKWLLGGPGLAYLYVRPGLSERLEPTSLSWFGVQDQFAFDPRGAVPREGARRFEMGTPAVGAAYTAAGGLEIVHEVGIPAIRVRNARLTAVLVEALRSTGLGVQGKLPPERRSAVTLVPHPDPEGAVRHLAERDVIVDARPGHVRFSPHFYNTERECERAVEALAEYGGGR